MACNHAVVCTVGFLILLPLGTLLARYARAFPRRWFWGHAVMQLVISGPIIFAGWALGHNLATTLGMASLNDPHQQIGIALLALYVAQLLLGALVRFVKMPALFPYQVHYGLTIEWAFATGGAHAVPDSAMHAWLALIIIFWVLYFLGMALLLRQFSREKEGREAMRVKMKEGSGSDDTHA